MVYIISVIDMSSHYYSRKEFVSIMVIVKLCVVAAVVI